MNLSDVFEETTTGTLPPSRIDVETVYRAGVRRRRIGIAARAALVVLPILALIATLIVAMDPGGDEETADIPPSTWVVHQVGGFDQKRLWAYIEPCAGCGFELRTSDNGGRTWTKYVVREADLKLPVLTTGSGGIAVVVNPNEVRVSADGWGVFRLAQFRAEPVAAPSANSPVYCNTEPYENANRMRVEDPGTVRIIDILAQSLGPAPTQPPFACLAAVRSPDGSILAAGRDPGTGKPAAARSTDDGYTWQAKVFEPAEPLDPGKPLVVTDLLGSTGGAAVVRFQQDQWTGLYRREAGMWRELRPASRAADHFVLADDNSLVAQAAGGAYTVNRPGDAVFEPISRPKGVGREVILGSTALPGGGHVAYNGNHVWTSADGRSWKAVGLG
ncbi:hypothetical protein [Virgisporangium aurantiacum]|uniref:Uncharacterized protein n=1 Tax=Virgisporangium aurantiacum TaxID=175570 RepID=A0A8J3Z6E5_9ACTN|nr:hypothetical protein [Virgisporangium aurantiacum]GIJ55808.1 hypothetical protein Vau01_033240 [Virgisporangium aurantiacum]